MKPTRKELLGVIDSLLYFATSGERYEDKNPYCIPRIKEAMQVIAREQGVKDYLDVKITRYDV